MLSSAGHIVCTPGSFVPLKNRPRVIDLKTSDESNTSYEGVSERFQGENSSRYS